MSEWNNFHHDNTGFLVAGKKLLESWPELHCGDRVEFPDANWVEQCLAQAPDAAPPSYAGDGSGLAATIQDAWRSFHTGDFYQATELSGQCGQLAHAPANKAAGIYATYLEPDKAAAQDCFLSGDERLDEVTDLYVKAAEMQAVDAMEKLDIEAALAELE